jgi:SAM-dependent MidA family methyltransferase
MASVRGRRSTQRASIDRVTGATIAFADFVDDALFDPRWGYYATGAVRFGTGGHYDTFPLALSPAFGRMVAECAFRAWQRFRSADHFEICEIGAGTGQLCLDTLLWIHERSRHGNAWKPFAAKVQYRILERSPALVSRQRRVLGPLADSVRWSRIDLSRRGCVRTPLAAHGLLIANEVLDCLPHHKVLPQRGGPPAVAVVVATLGKRPLTRTQLATAMADPKRRQQVTLHEGRAPLPSRSRLAAFLRAYCPGVLRPSAAPPYFACPAIEPLMDNAARLYDHAEALWIDYGEPHAFHRRAPITRRIFAGPPRSGLDVFDTPGANDITFMVDFSVVRQAAERSGWRVVHEGPQGTLARRAGIELDDDAVDMIIRHRALRWMLALAGIGPEERWHQRAVAWSRAAVPGHVPVRRYVERSVREFLSPRSPFKLVVMRK